LYPPIKVVASKETSSLKSVLGTLVCGNKLL